MRRNERIGTAAETWQARLEKLSKGRLLGRFFAASRQGLRDVGALFHPFLRTSEILVLKAPACGRAIAPRSNLAD